MKRTLQERLVAGLLAMGYTDKGPRGKYRWFVKGEVSNKPFWGMSMESVFVGKSGALRYGPVPSRSSSVNGGDRSEGFYQHVLQLGDGVLRSTK